VSRLDAAREEPPPWAAELARRFGTNRDRLRPEARREGLPGLLARAPADRRGSERIARILSRQLQGVEAHAPQVRLDAHPEARHR
jgi:hypothetical protein